MVLEKLDPAIFFEVGSMGMIGSLRTHIFVNSEGILDKIFVASFFTIATGAVIKTTKMMRGPPPKN